MAADDAQGKGRIDVRLNGDAVEFNKMAKSINLSAANLEQMRAT